MTKGSKLYDNHDDRLLIDQNSSLEFCGEDAEHASFFRHIQRHLTYDLATVKKKKKRSHNNIIFIYHILTRNQNV